MKQKNIVLWFIAVSAWLLALNACVDKLNVGDGFLEKEPGVDITIDVIFSRAEYARNFL